MLWVEPDVAENCELLEMENCSQKILHYLIWENMKRSFLCRKIFLIEEDVLGAKYWKLLLVCLFVWSCATGDETKS